MYLAMIICPGDTEGNAAFRFDDPFEDLVFTIVALMLCDDGRDRVEDLPHGLMEFRFAGIPFQYRFHDLIYVCHNTPSFYSKQSFR